MLLKIYYRYDVYAECIKEIIDEMISKSIDIHFPSSVSFLGPTQKDHFHDHLSISTHDFKVAVRIFTF